MPTWNIPTAAVTGNPIPASFGNDVIGDLEMLASGVGILGAGGPLAGSLESTGAPNFQIQAGAVTVSFSSGLSSAITFPVAYPNGLLTVQAIPFVSGSVANLSMNLAGATATAFSLAASQAGSAYSGSFVVTWFAIGC